MSIAEVPSPRKRLVLSMLDTIEFRLATIADVDELSRLFESFFDEAGYKDRGIEYSRPDALTWLAGVISRGVVPHLVAVQDDALVGVCAYELDRTFCVRPVAVLHTIFVTQPHRKSAIGRTLAALVTDLARLDGAVAFHAPLASGMPEQASLINLFRHVGFEPIGTIVGRRL